MPPFSARPEPRAFGLFHFAGGSDPLISSLPMKLLMSWEDIQADHLDVPACRVGYHTACDIMYPEVPRQATMLLFFLPFFLVP